MSLKVAVLAGGDSAESAISRSSADEVLRSLGERHLVELIELDENITKNITAFGPDVVFPVCLLYTSPSPRDRQKSRMPSSA